MRSDEPRLEEESRYLTMTVPVTANLMAENGIYEGDVNDAESELYQFGEFWLSDMKSDKLRDYLNAQVLFELQNRSSIKPGNSKDYYIEVLSIERLVIDGHLFKIHISLGTLADEKRSTREDKKRSEGK